MSHQAGSPAIVCLGEVLIDMMGQPQGRPLEECEHFAPKPGGAPANVAVGAVRLGQPAAFVGMVGRDAFGNLLRRTLEENGVDTRGLMGCPDQPTTLAFVASDEHGVPSFVFYRHPGADLSLRPEDVDDALIRSAKVFHFGSLSLVAPPAADATRHALDVALDSDAFVSYDPNYRPALWRHEDQAIAAMAGPLDRVHLLKVSADELRLLSGETDLKTGCARLAERGPRHIVVTRGSEGMVGWCDGEWVEVPAEPVDVVETTGCGDASMAGTLTRLLELDAIRGAGARIDARAFTEALQFANACAGVAATRVGAIPSLPRRDEVAAGR